MPVNDDVTVLAFGQSGQTVMIQRIIMTVDDVNAMIEHRDKAVFVFNEIIAISFNALKGFELEIMPFAVARVQKHGRRRVFGDDFVENFGLTMNIAYHNYQHCLTNFTKVYSNTFRLGFQVNCHNRSNILRQC
jgi:hypothetical protein